MRSLKYDRYFRFDIVYDEELDAYGVGLEEYNPACNNGDNVIYNASIYNKDEQRALDEIMRIINSRTQADEKITVRERGMYYIDLREQYPEVAFRHLKNDRATLVEYLANKALDMQETTIGEE